MKTLIALSLIAFINTAHATPVKKFDCRGLQVLHHEDDSAEVLFVEQKLSGTVSLEPGSSNIFTKYSYQLVDADNNPATARVAITTRYTRGGGRGGDGGFGTIKAVSASLNYLGQEHFFFCKEEIIPVPVPVALP